MSWSDWGKVVVRFASPTDGSKFRNTRVAAALIGAAAIVGFSIIYLASGRDVAPARRAALHTKNPAEPPWIYGRRDARFTLVEYADIECPYCREYFFVLRRWIDETGDVNWQWHHLPLANHEPAASESAKLAECLGKSGGNVAFWNALSWAYQHTRSNGVGVPQDLQPPLTSSAVEACVRDPSVMEIIRAQAVQAARENITATPTTRLIDRKTGRSITLQGVLDADALHSAIDHLLSEASTLEQ